MGFQVIKENDVTVVAVEGQLIVGNRQELKQKVLEELDDVRGPEAGLVVVQQGVVRLLTDVESCCSLSLELDHVFEIRCENPKIGSSSGFLPARNTAAGGGSDLGNDLLRHLDGTFDTALRFLRAYAQGEKLCPNVLSLQQVVHTLPRTRTDAVLFYHRACRYEFGESCARKGSEQSSP